MCACVVFKHLAASLKEDPQVSVVGQTPKDLDGAHSAGQSGGKAVPAKLVEVISLLHKHPCKTQCLPCHRERMHLCIWHQVCHLSFTANDALFYSVTPVLFLSHTSKHILCNKTGPCSMPHYWSVHSFYSGG